MKILRELLIIFTICLVGQLISGVLPIPFPASVLSLVILLLLLLSKAFKPHWIQNLSGFLLKNMAFFFIPAGVCIIEQYTALKGNILTLLLICLVTTFLTFTASAYAVTGTIKLLDKIRSRHNG